MANSTLRNTVNTILVMGGQTEISSDAEFNNSNGLGKTQYQTIKFVDLANRLLVTGINKKFINREYSLTTNDDDTDWQLNAAISIEGIQFKSFFNMTLEGNYNQRLREMSYNRFQELYPRPDLDARSAPEFWIPKPDDGTYPKRVIFYPYPDDVYTIKYQAKLDVVPLITAAQEIVFPPKYEHILWSKGWAFLEASLNEGRAGDIEFLAQSAVDEVMKDADGPLDESVYWDNGFSFNSYGNGDAGWGSRRDFIAGAYPDGDEVM